MKNVHPAVEQFSRLLTGLKPAVSLASPQANRLRKKPSLMLCFQPQKGLHCGPSPVWANIVPLKVS
jgi:hypothetical protein